MFVCLKVVILKFEGNTDRSASYLITWMQNILLVNLFYKKYIVTTCMRKKIPYGQLLPLHNINHYVTRYCAVY